MGGGESDNPVVDVKRCTGCGRCVAACPLRLLTLEVAGYRKHAVLVDSSCCTGCLQCVEPCPVKAIALAPSPLQGRGEG